MNTLSAYEQWQLKKYGNYIPEQSCEEFENSSREIEIKEESAPTSDYSDESIPSDLFTNH